MDRDALQEIMATNQPLTLLTAGGERYEVHHPDYLSVAPAPGTAVIVFKRDRPGFSILDLSTITDAQAGERAPE